MFLSMRMRRKESTVGVPSVCVSLSYKCRPQRRLVTAILLYYMEYTTYSHWPFASAPDAERVKSVLDVDVC